MLKRLNQVHLGIRATELCYAFINEDNKSLPISTIQKATLLYSVYTHPYLSIAGVVWGYVPPIRSVFFNMVT